MHIFHQTSYTYSSIYGWVKIYIMHKRKWRSGRRKSGGEKGEEERVGVAGKGG